MSDQQDDKSDAHQAPTDKSASKQPDQTAAADEGTQGHDQVQETEQAQETKADGVGTQTAINETSSSEDGDRLQEEGSEVQLPGASTFQRTVAFKEAEEVSQIVENDRYEDDPKLHEEKRATKEGYAEWKSSMLKNRSQPQHQGYASSKLQQSSRQQYQSQNQDFNQTEWMRERQQNRLILEERARRQQAWNQKALAVLPQDRMSRLQVGMITATFGESDLLADYINNRLCGSTYYLRDWARQAKASSFLTQWMSLVIPKLINRFKLEYLQLEEAGLSEQSAAIPGDDFRKNLTCVFTLIDQNSEIYNTEASENSQQLLERLVQHNLESLGPAAEPFVRPDFLKCVYYNTSVFFVTHLQVFCQSGGFELLKLILTGQEKKDGKPQPGGYIPSFRLFMRVMGIIYSTKDYFEPSYFQKLVFDMKDLCMDYALNKIDDESLRKIEARDLAKFVHQIESLLNCVVYERNRAGETRAFDTDVYQYTEQIELAFALKCLKMPILDKKFMGHAILEQQIKHVKAKQLQSDAAQQSRGLAAPGQGNHLQTVQHLRQRWLTQEALIQWMDENRIFNMMFGESFHPEVIKKSYFLLEFLYNNDRIGEEQINMMWDCATQKHEAYRIAILRALMFLGSKVKSKELQQMLSKIKQTPYSQTDKFLMLLLKTIAKNISQVIEGGDQNSKSKQMSSRRFDLMMGTSRRQGQRRSSDVGIQKSSFAGLDAKFMQHGGTSPRGLDGKRATWDDHDIRHISRATIVTDYIKPSQPHRAQRSNSVTKEPKLESLGGGPVDKQEGEVRHPAAAEEAQPKHTVVVQDVLGHDEASGVRTQEKGTDSNRTQDEGDFEGDITKVPEGKGEKNTADEELSPREENKNQEQANYLFDEEAEEALAQTKEERKVAHKKEDYEEEKVHGNAGPPGSPAAESEGTGNKLSIRQFLLDIQISAANPRGEDEAHGEELHQMRRLASEVLKLMWQYCMEEVVAQSGNPSSQSQANQPEGGSHGQPENQILDYLHLPHSQGNAGKLSPQVQQGAIENFCHVLNYYFPMSSFFFMNLCVQNIKRNRSVISSQIILEKLIRGTAFPLSVPDKPSLPGQQSQINSFGHLKTRLPKSTAELIMALDNDLSIVDECLTCYVEFKRVSVQMIFEQFGSMENDAIGGLGGDQDGDLETQSSLDNGNTNQTGEVRSRFSQSIVSSTQKSDTADNSLTNLTRSHQKASSNQRRSQQPYVVTSGQQAHGERGQSMPKHGILKNSKGQPAYATGEKGGIFDPEPSSSQDTGMQSALIPGSKLLGDKESSANNDGGSQHAENLAFLDDSMKVPDSTKIGGPTAMARSFSTQVPASTAMKAEEKAEQANILEEEKVSNKSEHQAEKSASEQNRAVIEFSPEKTSHNRSAQNSTSVQNQSHNRQFLNNLVTNQAFSLSYVQEMGKRLNFLKFLTTGSDCKTLKESQINILWECLVVNAFNEDERDQFFTMCTEILNTVQIQQYKASNRRAKEDHKAEDPFAGELLFDEDCLEMIFFEILLRLDYKSNTASGNSFTSRMYQCFERYFIYINEQYGQIVTSTASLSNLHLQTCDISAAPLQFEVFDPQLIGIEALWEIILGAADEQIYKRASQFLMRLYKKLSKAQLEEISSIKEMFFQQCLGQIKSGLADINAKNSSFIRSSQLGFEGISAGLGQGHQTSASGGHSPGQPLEMAELCYAGAIQELHPDLINSVSLDEPRNRIARSIKLMSQFIDDFEGMRTKQQRKGAKAEPDVQISVNNQISNGTPKKINLTVPLTTKVGELKDQIGENLNQRKPGSLLCLLWKGKDLNEDLKTLKDIKMKSIQPSGAHEPVKVFLTLKSNIELQMDTGVVEKQYSEEELAESLNTLRTFLGELPCSEEVAKLALKKCKLSLEEGLIMLTNPDQVGDLEEEVRQEQEAADSMQLFVNQNVNLADGQGKGGVDENGEPSPPPEKKLNDMISNRSECFDLLFDLLNLGVPDITQASWSLLTQVPVNQQLFRRIRLLNEDSPGNSSEMREPAGPMSQVEWSKIIDPNGIHKMLYSLQLVNQLITINNEKLSEQEIQERFEWRQRFLELGGFDHLYYILITYDFDTIQQANDSSAALGDRDEEHKNSGLADPKGQKGKGKGAPACTQEASAREAASRLKSQNILYQTTQAQCLGHLISIIKIFLQAAMLSNDQNDLLFLISQSSTSPFKKLGAAPGPGNAAQSYGQENSSSAGEAQSDKDGNSSVNTPKFHNSFTSTTPPALKEESEAQITLNDQNGIFNYTAVNEREAPQQKFKAGVQKQINTQVDDFPKLIEQMSQKGIAKNILDNVVDFSTFVQKLLQIVQTCTCVFQDLDGNRVRERARDPTEGRGQAQGDDDPVPQLVQNCLDLLLPCVLWDPEPLLKQLYSFGPFEPLLISGIIQSKSEKIRKGLEQNFRTLCYHIEERCHKAEQVRTSQSQGPERALVAEPKSSLIDESGAGERPPTASNPKLFILKVLMRNLPQSVVQGKFRNLEYEFFDEYFSLMSALIRICRGSFFVSEKSPLEAGSERRFFLEDSQKFDTRRILAFCIDIIKTNYSILSGQIQPQDKRLSESKQSSAERLLCGYMQLCQSILEIIPQVKGEMSKNCNLVDTVMDFIFNTDSSLQHYKQGKDKGKMPPQAKQLGRQTRKRAFSLMLTLSDKNEENFAAALKILYNFHGKIERSWRYIDMSEFDADVGIKQASGYVGLRNFGCTCYMNSLLQQLYMIPDLRRHVLGIQFEQEQSHEGQDELEENVLYQLQGIFANLQESEKSYFIPRGFVNAFKFYGEPVNVRVQQDTHEFYNALCDQIEQLIPKPAVVAQEGEEAKDDQSHNFLQSTIGGTLCNETRSLEPEHPYVGERDEAFYAIGLDIKNKKNIQEALDLYVKPDVLEGDNKYHCEQYDLKISAQRRTYLKDLSDTVVIHLKRFEFDYSTMQRWKINDYCEFPERINFRKWAKEGIQEQMQRDGGNPEERIDEDAENGAEDEEAANENIEALNDDPTAGQGVAEPIPMGVDIESELNMIGPDNKDTAKEQFISLTNQNASGGSRASKQRRVRSSTRKTDPSAPVRAFGKPSTKESQPLNLSAEFSDIDGNEGPKVEEQRMRTSSAEPHQIDSSKANEAGSQKIGKFQKEAAIIDEDVNSEDARSVGDSNTIAQSEKNQPKKEKLRQRKERRGPTKALRDNLNSARNLIGEEERHTRQKKRQEADKYEYELVGVLIHSGSADAGHYYSFIKERNKKSPNYGQWCEFNDTTVRETSFEQLKKECFGGQQQKNQDNEFENENTNNENRIFERCCSAYLVLYERVNKTQDKIKEGQLTKIMAQKQEEHKKQLFNKIHEQNQAFKHLKIFSDGDFIKFMLDYVSQCAFQEVLYFQKEFSDTCKISMQRDLTGAYLEDLDAQRRKVERQAATLALKGLEPVPQEVVLTRDYYQQQINIRSSMWDVDIFDTAIEGNNIGDKDLKEIDVGLKTIQLATILAQDIILKLKDTQSFVQLLQQLNQMYSSHALACVWFIKWIQEQQNVLQEVLLVSPHPEVREVFATLLSTTFSVTVKNEESYLQATASLADFDCSQKDINDGTVGEQRVQLSAAIRLVKLIINGMMNCARVNWRNFDEFFILLKDFAQTHFLVTQYLIHKSMISILLEFVMNNKPPFYNSQGGSSYRMGDSVQQPNFQAAYQLFSYLVKCCVTTGINLVGKYSRQSVFQEESKTIPMPEDHIMGFLTPDCQQEIFQSAHQCSDQQNQAVAEAILHLSWGDIKVSAFFLSELIGHIQHRKSSNNTLNFHFQLIQDLISLDDSKTYKRRRIEDFFNFGQDYNYGNVGGPTSGNGRQVQAYCNPQAIFLFLARTRTSHPIYTIKLLHFIGVLAMRERQVFELVEEMASQREWIWDFIHRIAGESTQIQRAQQRYNLNLIDLQQSTVQMYAQIFGVPEDLLQAHAREYARRREGAEPEQPQKGRKGAGPEGHRERDGNFVRNIATEAAARLQEDAGVVHHETPRNNQDASEAAVTSAGHSGRRGEGPAGRQGAAVDLESFQEPEAAPFSESDHEENIMNLIPQDGSQHQHDKVDGVAPVLTNNDSFSGIPELMPTRKEAASSPQAALSFSSDRPGKHAAEPTDGRKVDFYPSSAEVGKAPDDVVAQAYGKGTEDSANQADHSFNEQEYGDEQDAVLRAQSKAAEEVDPDKVARALREAQAQRERAAEGQGYEVTTQKNNFLAAEDDDMSDIRGALVQLGSSGSNQNFNPFKSRAQDGAQGQDPTSKSQATLPMASRDDQLFEQMEIDEDFLGGVGDGLADLRDAPRELSGPNGLRVETDFQSDAEAEAFGGQIERAEGGNDGIADGYFDDFDNQDPEFMKRQMEEYERYQKAFQQQKEGQPRD